MLTIVYMDGIYDGEKKWKDKIKNFIEVFKKEGSQTSLIVVNVLENVLKEN